MHAKDCLSGLHKYKLQLQRDYNAHKTTRTSQARKFKFKSILYVSAHRVFFMDALIRECMCHHCAPYISKSQFLIYTWLTAQFAICAQHQEVLKEVSSSSNINIHKSSIYFITHYLDFICRCRNVVIVFNS